MATRQFPHPSAEASAFKVGDQVRWAVLSGQSPYVGSVTHIHPGINKVDVEFPVGGNQRLSPEELVIVTDMMGKSTVTKDTSYSSYDKAKSEAANGKIADKAKKMAAKVAALSAGLTEEAYKTSKMASGVAKKFAEDVVEKLASDTLTCIQDGLSDIQTYQKLYPTYASVCSDGFMRAAIGRVYKEAFQFVGDKPQVVKWLEQEGFEVEKVDNTPATADTGIQRFYVSPKDSGGEPILEFPAGDPNHPDTQWTSVVELSVEPDRSETGTGGWVYRLLAKGKAQPIKVFPSGKEQEMIKYLKDLTGKDSGLKKIL